MPSPYVNGRIMNLETPDGKNIKVTIKRVISITISPVLEVQLHIPGYDRAILKLYDRRTGGPRSRAPYNEGAESAWQDCVRSGLAKEIVEDLQYEDDMRKARRLGIADETDNETSDDDDEDNDDSRNEVQEQEAWIYHTVQRFYTTEVRAYSELQSLQGRCIPRFITSVIDNSPKRPADLPAAFFQIPGILLEYIDGFTLADIALHIPDQPRVWETVVKNAMAVAEAINNAGVLHNDCQPRNVLIANPKQGQYQSYFIDFAHCAFKTDYKDTEDFLNDDGFLCHLLARDNRRAIALLMIKRIEQRTPFKIEIEGIIPYDA